MAERAELTGVAFEDAYASCFRVAYQAAFRVLGSRSEAEDIAQESLVRAYSRWESINGYANAWVTRVATNLALDGLRRRGRHRWLPARDDEPSDGGRIDLARAIAVLPKRQREAVALRYIADLPEAEVARLMQCSVGSVKTHASRGLAALRASGHLATENS